MVPAGELAPFSQGEAGTVVGGMSRAPRGYVENPSPGLVEKFMEPAITSPEAKLISDLRKAGFDQAQAETTAANILKRGTPKVTATPSAAEPSDLTAQITAFLRANPGQIAHVEAKIEASSGPFREELRKALRAAIAQMGDPAKTAERHRLAQEALRAQATGVVER